MHQTSGTPSQNIALKLVEIHLAQDFMLLAVDRGIVLMRQLLVSVSLCTMDRLTAFTVSPAKFKLIVDIVDAVGLLKTVRAELSSRERAALINNEEFTGGRTSGVDVCHAETLRCEATLSPL